MKNFKLFCFGFGQVAKYFIKNLIKNNFNFELEKKSFKQICPIEMLDKLKHPITTKFSVKAAV